jgi:hypothetical protein
MTYVDPNPPVQPVRQPFCMEAVVVCDKYADFLVHTLPHNKFLFDRIVVVTSFEDKATQRVCEFHHVECIRTDELLSRKGEFHKGKGINAGLEALSLRGWAVHLDADIYLPPQTRLLLQAADLDPAFIYGIDRFNVRGFEAWAEFQGVPRLQHECETYIHLGAFPMGTRVMHRHAGGYVPIGFFQLWNPGVSGVRGYVAGHADAGRGDTLFAQQWPRSRRGFIPEIVGYHLESVDASNAANWSGRTTAPFALKVP